MPKFPSVSRTDYYDHRSMQQSPYSTNSSPYASSSPQFHSPHPSGTSHPAVFPISYDYQTLGQSSPHSSPYYGNGGPSRAPMNGYGQSQPGYSPRLENPNPVMYQQLQDALYASPLHHHQLANSPLVGGSYLSPTAHDYGDMDETAGAMMLSSNGEAVYFCKICPTSRSFISKATLKKHIQYCHQEKPMCPFCSTCIRADNMSRHIKKYCPQAGVKRKNQHEIEAERILVESGIIDNISITSSPKRKLLKDVPLKGEPSGIASSAMAASPLASTSNTKPLSMMDIKNIVDMDLLLSLSPMTANPAAAAAAAAANIIAPDPITSPNLRLLALQQEQGTESRDRAEQAAASSSSPSLSSSRPTHSIMNRRHEPALADFKAMRPEFADYPYQQSAAPGLDSTMAQRRRSYTSSQAESLLRTVAGFPYPTQYQWHLNTPTSTGREQYMPVGDSSEPLASNHHTLPSRTQQSPSGQLSIRTDSLGQNGSQPYLFSLKGQNPNGSSLQPLREMIHAQDYSRRSNGSLELTSYRSHPLNHSKSELSPSTPGSGNYLPPLFQLSISPSASYHP